ncbi:MAG: glycosyltransferase family 2 protein [Prolixibacteraceae bacterium]
MQQLISAIILTYNEEKHITRCIRSLTGIADEIFVIDSYSTDNTVKTASSLGAKVYQNPWKNYASQFNWALENCPIRSTWVWRIDADEFIEESGGPVRAQIEKLPDHITGIYIKRKIVFLDRELLHGGWFPVWHLKIWRYGKGYCENRWMDEHIKLTEGESIKIDCNQIDWNLNDLSWWTEKHNSYASREVIDMLDTKYLIFSENQIPPRLFGSDEQRKRWLKIRYVNLPLFVRPLINFIYRYFFRLGFLDGKQGLIWNFLQGFWYRFLVDTKIYELSKKHNHNREQLISHLKSLYK